MSLLLIVPVVPLFSGSSRHQGANRFGNPPPPNSTGAVLALILRRCSWSIRAIAIPAYVDYQQRAQVMQTQPTQ
jgi:hypothetical protein